MTSEPNQERAAHTAAQITDGAGDEWNIGTHLGNLTITAITDSIARLALTPVGATPHQTWSIVPSAGSLVAPQATSETTHGALIMRTATMTLSVRLGDLHVAVLRADGSTVLADAGNNAWGANDAGELQWHVALRPGERIYGGGQRTGTLDKRGRTMQFWSDDPQGIHGDQTDTMYQNASFIIGLHKGKAHGIFYDTNWRSGVDIGAQNPQRLTFTTTGPDIVAFVFAGPTLADVIAQYTSITGRMPPQPRWSLGNQQSRWGYMNAAEVRGIAQSFREQRIPCDAIYLDIDYMRGYRDFTWDPERFPDPAGLVSDLRAQGFRVVPIIDPGVKVDPEYDVYREGLERGYFVRNADGSVFEGYVWPGLSVWADFAQPEVGKWWGDHHASLLDIGVAGIWDDMNEPSQAGMSAPPDVTVPFGATLPLDTLHGSGDQPLSHAAFHNAYGLMMAQATRDALVRLRPDERPFLLTRSATSGSQRFAIVWNGDNTSIWPHVKMAVTMNLGVGLSGFPVTGLDIGGFWGDAQPELLVRFTQVGAFMPFCRNHSARETVYQEPWIFGDPYTSAIRTAIERRYTLLPLLATLFHEANTTGAPIMRPLAWIAPDDAASVACEDQFLFGNDLLVAPVLEEGATTRNVVLPPGEWFDWATQVVHRGGQRITVPVDLTTTPLFTRAGSILPKTGVVQHTDESPTEPLTLHVHLTPTARTATLTLWDDDDHPQAAERGTYAEYRATAEWVGDAITVHVEQSGGAMPPRYAAVRAALHLPAGYRVTAQGEASGDLTNLPLDFRFTVSQDA